ncbi:alpha/beta hydrolase-fold protein [Ekhidna sp.]|uniref:alpha/beta hydrolase-fold protein n=1 Tax=Ekhidna sp. TaxID=2608089 RepID=UPI0032972CDB
MNFSSKILFTLLAIIPVLSNAQTPISAGNTFTIESSAYESSREIQVYTPDGYDSITKNYPVLYVLDGQRWYMQAVSYQKLFQEYGYTPDFIVVGINTNDSGRYGFFNNSKKLSKFLEKDVIAFVENNFNTSNERILFGWQFAGASALNILFSDSELFSGFLAASPIPINNVIIDSSQEDLKTKSLFLVTSHAENQVNSGVNDFVKQLEDTTTPLKWTRQIVESEPLSSFGHRTTPVHALYHGLRFYYDDYPLLEFDKIEDFHSLGGFQYVESYYNSRANKYGLSNIIPQEGMFFLLRLGLDENDYSVFKRFMTIFIEKNVLGGVNIGWGTRYAEFSLQNEDYSLAKSIYQILCDRFPDNARPFHGLGKVYLAQNDKVKAKNLFRAAIEIAQKNNDRKLTQYQQDLDSLK